MTGLTLLAVVLAVVGGLYGLHRLALWLESKGHLYYKHRQPSGSALGQAALEIQSILEPSKETMVEVMREERRIESPSGDPRDPDARED